MKEFLKPTIVKIILTLLFLFIFEWTMFGFPLSDYTTNINELRTLSFLNIVINIIFWYLFSSLIIYGYKRFKKNKIYPK